jgi:ATP-dependent DNA ligase
MARPLGGRRHHTGATALPRWIKPQLTKLVDQPPDGPEWLHEIKFDGYRTHAGSGCCPDSDPHRARLPAIAAAVAKLPARLAYFDGELCGVRPAGTTAFTLIQNASDTANSGALVFFLFDLLHLNGEAITPMPVRTIIPRRAEGKALIVGTSRQQQKPDDEDHHLVRAAVVQAGRA